MMHSDELVKIIDSLKDIWERLALRYGDNIQLVDAVYKDIQLYSWSKRSQRTHRLHQYPGAFKCFVRSWNGVIFIKTHLKTHFSSNALHSSEVAKLVHLKKTNYLTCEENFANGLWLLMTTLIRLSQSTYD